MFGHLEMRAIGLLLVESSGARNIRAALSSAHVQWLREQGLATDEGELTEDGRLLAHCTLTNVEFALRPNAKKRHGEGT